MSSYSVGMRKSGRLALFGVSAAAAMSLLFPPAASADTVVTCSAGPFQESGGDASVSISGCDGPLADRVPASLSLSVDNNFGTGSFGFGSLQPPATAIGWITWSDGQVGRLQGTARSTGFSSGSGGNSSVALDIVDGPFTGGVIEFSGGYSAGSAGATYGHFTPAGGKVTIRLP